MMFYGLSKYIYIYIYTEECLIFQISCAAIYEKLMHVRHKNFHFRTTIFCHSSVLWKKNEILYRTDCVLNSVAQGDRVVIGVICEQMLWIKFLSTSCWMLPNTFDDIVCDDVISWKQCLHYWPFVVGIHQLLGSLAGPEVVIMTIYDAVIDSEICIKTTLQIQ